MCGIFGIISQVHDVREQIINGLTQLQNRGYDSCGVGLLDSGKFLIRKYASTVDGNSLSILSDAILSDIKSEVSMGDGKKYKLGIGHNRWATHGKKTDKNAHPHVSEDNQFILVHNGIIENYNILKLRLEKKGYNFYSKTDTEVIVVLISYYYKTSGDTTYSIKRAINDLVGTYGLVILNRDEPNEIHCVRNGSPILVGMTEDVCIITSEQSGFHNQVNTYVTLENDDICSICKTGSGLTIKTENVYTESKLMIKCRELSPTPYKHWTIKEIHEQPQTIMNAINMGGRIKNESEVKLGGLDEHKEMLKVVENLIILGCGSSYNAGLYGSQYIKQICDFNSVQVIDGGDFVSIDIPRNGKTAFILISQSGETKDLHRCVEIAKEQDIVTMGIINVVGSQIAREVDCGIYCNTGIEVGVASTKSFTSQVVCLSLLSIWFAQLREINKNARISMVRNIQNLANDYKRTLEMIECKIERIAHTMKDEKNMFIIGKGSDAFIAHEGSLKIKEISYIHSESYSASALKHGPLALLDKSFPVILLNCVEKHISKITSCYEEIISRDAPVIIIRSYDLNTKLHPSTCEVVIPVNRDYGSLLGLIPLQLLSYYLSIGRGINPDTPKNLAKVVTVE